MWTLTMSLASITTSAASDVTNKFDCQNNCAAGQRGRCPDDRQTLEEVTDADLHGSFTLHTIWC
ncbi:hypothetical protein SAMN05414139_10470 [Burkholderia sp. D7]|nr:hypothetical protein SAMN05414139_10470 [Burkholderia sp. D7]